MLTWIAAAHEALQEPIFTIGQASYSLYALLKLLLFVVLLLRGARLLERVLQFRVFPRLRMEPGAAYALAELTRYAAILLGLMVGLQTWGIELSSITVLFGALGIGIGFGLQTIASNFVSGLILLTERPVQVGDRIDLGDLHGRVVRIQFRATEIQTNDNIAVIVPNSELISQRVVNWSRGGDSIRMRVAVGVAYGSDVAKVRAALLEAAASVASALADPPPDVRLRRFGDSSLDFELLAWTRAMLHRRGAFVSELNLAIHAALERNGIQIPFPQRDLHLSSAAPLELAPTRRGAEPRTAGGSEDNGS